MKYGFHRPMIRFASSIFLLMVMASVTTAYTLVFRDGRRIEIPSGFTLTKVTLTYELSPGFTKTLSLSLLDIPATERANREPAGGFFKHMDRAETQSDPAPTQAAASTAEPATVRQRHARTTLTNRDLEPFEARRVEAERQYERRR